MDKYFKIIKFCLILFALFIPTYLLINSFLIVQKFIFFSENFRKFWLLFALTLLASELVMVPSIRATSYKKKAKRFLGIIIPITLFMSSIAALEYFPNSNYKLISVYKPSEILNFPDQHFFKLKKYYASCKNYSLYKSKKYSHGRDPQVEEFLYFSTALFEDSTKSGGNNNIFIGVEYSKRISNSVFFNRDLQKIFDEFIKKSIAN